MKHSYSILILVSILIGALIVLFFLRANRLKRERTAYISAYVFPAALRSKLALTFPQLDSHQLDQAQRALKQFFLACLEAGAVRGKRSVGMPSKLVDTAWHEFILMTREYTRFCASAFGGYLHHTPGTELKRGLEEPLVNTLHQVRTSNTPLGWASLYGVPLVFAIDKACEIPGGYHYGQSEMDLLEHKRQQYYPAQGGCTTSFGTGWSCDFGLNWGDSGSCGDGGGGDGGGGGGCGGGCGS
jgi:hypothetical protein